MTKSIRNYFYKGFLALMVLSFILQPALAETPADKAAKEAKSNMKGVAAVAGIAGVAAGGVAVMMGAPLIAGVAVAVGVGVLGAMAMKAGLKAIDSVTQRKNQESALEKAINGDTYEVHDPFDENQKTTVK